MKKYKNIGLDIDDTLTTFELEDKLLRDVYPQLTSHPEGWRTWNPGQDPASEITEQQSDAMWSKPAKDDPSISNIEYLWYHSRVNLNVWRAVNSFLDKSEMYNGIYIISHRDDTQTVIENTRDNLEKQGVNFANIRDMIFVNQSDKKLEVAKSLDIDLMFEDKPSTLQQFYADNTIDTAKVLRPWNAGTRATYRVNPLNGEIKELTTLIHD